MSLPRIFELARKLGTPVIMTDTMGREPLVVLPLDQFEAMAGVSGDTPDISPVLQEKTLNKAKETPLEPIVPEPAAPLAAVEGLATEERFYLEPLEGEESSQG